MDIQILSMEIIQDAKLACRLYCEAMKEIKTSNFKECEQLMYMGDDAYIRAYCAYGRLIRNEVSIACLFTQAQDYLTSAELLKRICIEIIEIYELLFKS